MFSGNALLAKTQVMFSQINPPIKPYAYDSTLILEFFYFKRKRKERLSVKTFLTGYQIFINILHHIYHYISLSVETCQQLKRHFFLAPSNNLTIK